MPKNTDYRDFKKYEPVSKLKFFKNQALTGVFTVFNTISYKSFIEQSCKVKMTEY